nr:hypothetical protein GCM10025732_50600 [Glycomyces mayteni]
MSVHDMDEVHHMSDPARPRATLSEVAARAGVSKATASKVLNARPGVAEETRRLVREAITELGYVPTTGPRETPGGQSIHVVFDTILNMYAVYVLDGIISGARDLGVAVVTSSLEEGGPGHPVPLGADRIKEIAAQGAAGLVVVTAELTGEEMTACEQADLPLVVIDPANPLDERVTSLGATNWAGACRPRGTCSTWATGGSASRAGLCSRSLRASACTATGRPWSRPGSSSTRRSWARASSRSRPARCSPTGCSAWPTPDRDLRGQRQHRGGRAAQRPAPRPRDPR